MWWLTVGLLAYYGCMVQCEIDHGAGIMTASELDNIYNELSHLHDENWGTYDKNDEYMMSDLDDTEWETEEDANYYNLAKDIYAETSDDEDKKHMLDIDDDYKAVDEDDDRRYKYSTHSVFVVKLATFKEACSYCASVYGSSVATVGSRGKNRKMARARRQAWIGLNNKNEWESKSKASFRNFGGEASSGRCVTIGPDGRWKRTNCNKRFFFWCDNRNVPKPGTGEKNRDGKLAVSKNVRYLTPKNVVKCNLHEKGQDGLDRSRSTVTLKFDTRREVYLLAQRGYYLTILRHHSRKLARRGCYLATMKITRRLGLKRRKGKYYIKVRVREAAPTEYMPSADFDITKQRVQNNGIEERLSRIGGTDDDDTMLENGLTQYQNNLLDGNLDNEYNEMISEAVDFDDIDVNDDIDIEEGENDDQYLSGDDYEDNDDYDFQDTNYDDDTSDDIDASNNNNNEEDDSYVYDYEQDIYNEDNSMNDADLSKFMDDRESLFSNDFKEFYTLDENDEEYEQYYGNALNGDYDDNYDGYSDDLANADDEYDYDENESEEEDEDNEEEWRRRRWRFRAPRIRIPRPRIRIPRPRIRLPRIDPRRALDAAARAARDAKDKLARAARDAARAAARAARDAARKAKDLAKKVKSGLVTAVNAVGKFVMKILDKLAFEKYVSKTITIAKKLKHTKTWTRKTRQTIKFGNIGTLTVDTYGRLTITAGVDFFTSITLTIGGRWSVITFAIAKIRAILELRHHLIFTFNMDLEARVNARLNFIEIGPRSPITTMIGIVPVVWRPFLKPYIGFTLNSKLNFNLNVGYNNVYFKAGFEIRGGRFVPIKKAAKPKMVRNWSLKNGQGDCGIRVNMNPYIGAEFLITIYGTFTLGLEIRLNGNAVLSLPVNRGGGVCRTRPMQAALEMSPNIQLFLIARITKIFGIKLPSKMRVNKRVKIITIPIGRFNVYIKLPTFMDRAFATICNCNKNTRGGSVVRRPSPRRPTTRPRITPPRRPTRRPYRRPTVRRPIVRRPIVRRPIIRRPYYPRRPIIRRPIIRRPPWRRPTWRRPTIRRPVWRRPTWRRPTWRRPTWRRPTIRRPVWRRPTIRRPTWRRPTIRRPVWRRPTWRRPVYRRPRRTIYRRPRRTIYRRPRRTVYRRPRRTVYRRRVYRRPRRTYRPVRTYRRYRPYRRRVYRRPRRTYRPRRYRPRRYRPVRRYWGRRRAWDKDEQAFNDDTDTNMDNDNDSDNNNENEETSNLEDTSDNNENNEDNEDTSDYDYDINELNEIEMNAEENYEENYDDDDILTQAENTIQE